MAMDPAVLGALIISNIEAATGNPMPAISIPIWNAIAAAIVEHITTAAQVAVAVESVSGVTTGPGVSGPGAGTGTIT